MENFDPKGFSKAVRLIAGFINHTLAEAQPVELDEWVCASNENQKVLSIKLSTKKTFLN